MEECIQNEKAYSLQQQSNLQQCEQREGFHSFYIFPILYVVSVYCSPILAGLEQLVPAAAYFIFLPFVFGGLNIVAAVNYCKPENRIMMLNAAVLVKYALIPFYIFGGFLIIIGALMTFIPVPFMIFVGPMLAVLGTAFGWLILAFGSPYTIAYLRLSSKTKIRPAVMAVLHSVLQFFFTLDVIDVMILTLKERKWKKLTIGIIVLLTTAIILLFVWIVVKIAGSLGNNY